MNKNLSLFILMLLASISTQAQDFDWQYITAWSIKTPYHIPKEAYIAQSSVPLQKKQRDKYFIPLLANQSSVYGTDYQVAIVGKLELTAGKSAILYAVYPWQDDTRFIGATYLIATFEKDGQGIDVSYLTSYNRGPIGKPGGISILQEGEAYTVYVAEWEAGEFSKRLAAKFDKQGKFLSK